MRERIRKGVMLIMRLPMDGRGIDAKSVLEVDCELRGESFRFRFSAIKKRTPNKTNLAWSARLLTGCSVCLVHSYFVLSAFLPSSQSSSIIFNNKILLVCPRSGRGEATTDEP